MTNRLPLAAFAILIGLIICCSAPRLHAQTTLDSEIQKVFSWLPPDTETVIVADARKRSFLNVDVFKETDEKDESERGSDPTVSVQDIAERFQLLPLTLLSINHGFLVELFKNHQMTLAVEGSRHFRDTYDGLGLLPYEGCQIAIFRDDVRTDGELLLDRNKGHATKPEELEEQTAFVFEEDWEGTWTLHVLFPQRNVLAVCTDQGYAKQLLQRMKQVEVDRAFPESLPEWKYTNTSAPFWGLRHFDRSQAELDPSSPFGGPKIANLPDEQAVGFGFSFDPYASSIVTVTYLSGDPDIQKKLIVDRDPMVEDELPPARVDLADLKPGIVRLSFVVFTRGQLGLFFFGFEGMLGHAVIV